MVDKDYETIVTFPAIVCRGGRITIPLDYVNKLGIEESDRLRLTIRTQQRDEEPLIARVTGSSRFTISRPYRDSLGIKEGDKLDITMQVEKPRNPIKEVSEYTDSFTTIIEGVELILPPRFDEWEGRSVKVMLLLLDHDEVSSEPEVEIKVEETPEAKTESEPEPILEPETAENIVSKDEADIDQQVKELHAKGLNDKEKAEELGVSVLAVFSARRRLERKGELVIPEPEPEHKEEDPIQKVESDFDEQVTALHAQGLRDKEIAKRLGIHKNRVGKIRKELRLEPHSPKRRFTDQELIDLHALGLNDREIGERLGATRDGIRYHRKKLGLEVNKPKPASTEEAPIQEPAPDPEPEPEPTPEKESDEGLCPKGLSPTTDIEKCKWEDCEFYKRGLGDTLPKCNWVPEEVDPIPQEPEESVEPESDVVLRFCQSAKHGAKRVPHEKKILIEDYIAYVCTICGNRTPDIKLSEES